MRAARRNAWVIGLWLLLGLLLAVTKVIQPSFGAQGISNLAIAALPVALAAAGQTIAVLTGGIDLSIGSMMALTSVLAATLMSGSSDEAAILIVLLVLGVGLLIGAVNGALIMTTRVPDIIVTLAMLFVWAGVALLILNTPGGSAAPWLRDLISGTLVSEWLPRSLVVLVVIVALVWIPLRRSMLGLSIYAVGSDRLSAFRSGVNVGRTKVAAYALTGLFAAMGGLALTMSTGIGDPVPGPYLLASVAAVVLGGVSLVGGRGGLVGPIVAVFILRLARADLAFIGVDPGFATVIEGAIMVGVVMLGAAAVLRRKRS
jgi:ribose transport system permease protein